MTRLIAFSIPISAGALIALMVLAATGEALDQKRHASELNGCMNTAVGMTVASDVKDPYPPIMKPVNCCKARTCCPSPNPFED